MKNMKLSIISLLAVVSTGLALAAPDLAAPLPASVAVKPASDMAVLTNKGLTSHVDKVLEQISRNMLPAPEMIDAQAETAINRDMNLSRSTGQMLRPIGYMEIENSRVIFASEDGVRVLRLKENSRLGVMKIIKISDFGVEYQVSGKVMYAPLAYMASEPPKAGQVINLSTQPNAVPAAAFGTQPAPSR